MTMLLVIVFGAPYLFCRYRCIYFLPLTNTILKGQCTEHGHNCLISPVWPRDIQSYHVIQPLWLTILFFSFSLSLCALSPTWPRSVRSLWHVVLWRRGALGDRRGQVHEDGWHERPWWRFPLPQEITGVRERAGHSVRGAGLGSERAKLVPTC